MRTPYPTHSGRWGGTHREEGKSSTSMSSQRKAFNQNICIRATWNWGATCCASLPCMLSLVSKEFQSTTKLNLNFINLLVRCFGVGLILGQRKVRNPVEHVCCSPAAYGASISCLALGGPRNSVLASSRQRSKRSWQTGPASEPRV